MRTRAIIILLLFLSMLFLMVYNASSQVVYSSWASTQIRHAVEVDKPKVMYDTTINYDVFPYTMRITSIFMYKDFQLRVIRDNGIKMYINSGQMQVMLKPDDEFAILEKLISQIK
jgi:hypothetical protein